MGITVVVLTIILQNSFGVEAFYDYDTYKNFDECTSTGDNMVLSLPLEYPDQIKKVSYVCHKEIVTYGE